MKRFKKIIVVYDILPGGDETLERAIELAKRNDAHLTLLNVVDPSRGWEHIDQHKRMIERVAVGIPLPTYRKDHVVLLGTPVIEILGEASARQADLIMTSDGYAGEYEQMFGLDLTTDLMRRADCPVWVVHAKTKQNYHRVVAAVNAGKEDALTDPANRRILEMASSLAELEQAELHVVYAWDFEGQDKNRMDNGLSPSEYADRMKLAHLEHLGQLVDLGRTVLGDPLTFIPVVQHGDAVSVVHDYIETQKADILVTDGKVSNPVMSAIISTKATKFLAQAACSVLFARPLPANFEQAATAAE
ncbi:universal stress protein [Magnetovibrio sp. PR-2]|uniref:universal stress protein n=1 Tax=Magnetovibrio sp. PR-2 TaxID=3120356 RepID=UPI002FCE3407